MIYNRALNQSSTKSTKSSRLFKGPVLLGFFSLILLMLASFCTFFLNTAHANSTIFTAKPPVSSQQYALLPDDPVTGCPTGYTALGGIITTPPTTNVINNRVVAFARGGDGQTYYQVSAGFPFSGWRSLGGYTDSTPASIVIGTTLYVEVTGTDGTRFYRSTIDGFTFTEWKRGTVNATTNSSAVLAGVTYNFVSGLSGTQPNLCVLLTGGTTPTPTPTATSTPTPGNDPITGCAAGYLALGGIITTPPTASVIGNRVVAFARGGDGQVYFQYSSGGTFSGWTSIGGSTNSTPMSIVIGSTLFVEIIGTDGSRQYKTSSDGVGYSMTWTKGTVGAVTNPTATLGTTGYTFASGLTGTQPNLCVALTFGVAPTPTITPNPTPTGNPNFDAVTGCQTGYTALGGIITTPPTAGVAGNRVVAFARGGDGQVYFQSSTSFPFSGWQSLGGYTDSPPMTVVVGTTLYMEAIGTDGNRYNRSTTDGLNFTQWAPGTFGATTNPITILGTTRYTFASGLSGTQPNLCVLLTPGVAPTVTPTPTPTATPTPGTDPVTGCPAGYLALGGIITTPPTASTINNRVVAFARGGDGQVYYQYSSGGSFSGWASLGGSTNSTPMSTVSGSTLYVEIIGTDGNRQYKASTDGVNFTSTWVFATTGATINSTATLGTTMYSFVSGLSGTQPNLCTLITTGVPTPTPATGPTPNPSTGCAADYISLGGIIFSEPTASIINNRIYVFARGGDNKVYYQYSTDSAFSGWLTIDGATYSAPMSTVIGSTLYVEIINTDNVRQYRSTTNGTNYTDWTAGTFGATTHPTVVFGGKTYTFAKGTNNSPHLCVKIQ